MIKNKNVKKETKITEVSWECTKNERKPITKLDISMISFIDFTGLEVHGYLIASCFKVNLFPSNLLNFDPTFCLVQGK